MLCQQAFQDLTGKVSSSTGRHGNRDSTLILLAYRHGLRVSELVALRWSQVDFSSGTIHINRLKHGISSTHPLRARELRWLRQLQREYPNSPYLFVSERGTPMAAATALVQINERIKSSRAIDEKPITLKARYKQVSSRLEKAAVWDNPKKQKALEKLLAQIESLLDDNLLSSNE